MPRLSKRDKQEWTLFLHPTTGRKTYNDLRRKCLLSCKQSYCTQVIECRKFTPKWRRAVRQQP